MNNGEILDLLSVVAAYDGRTIGEADALAWSDAAEHGRWTYENARDAVKAHYAESTDWIMPGHVTQRIRARRSEPPPSSALPAATPRTAEEHHRNRVVEWFAERIGIEHERRSGELRACQAIACPYCGAHENRPCVQTAGGRPRKGNLPIEVPHLHRRRAYRQTQE